MLTQDKPDIWGVGRIIDSGRSVPYGSTICERVSGRERAQRWLREVGVVEDDIVMFVSMFSEALQLVPFEDAANELGATFCSADSAASDARRVASLMDEFGPRAVLGVDEGTLDGWPEDAGDPLDAFAGVPVIAARPSAWRRLVDAGLTPYLWVHVGPVVAIECLQRSGPHVAETAWTVVEDHGEICLGDVRAVRPSDRLVRTGVRGQVVRDPCSCGRPEPRLRLNGPATAPSAT